MTRYSLIIRLLREKEKLPCQQLFHWIYLHLNVSFKVHWFRLGSRDITCAASRVQHAPETHLNMHINDSPRRLCRRSIASERQSVKEDPKWVHTVSRATIGAASIHFVEDCVDWSCFWVIQNSTRARCRMTIKRIARSANTSKRRRPPMTTFTREFCSVMKLTFDRICG